MFQKYVRSVLPVLLAVGLAIGLMINNAKAEESSTGQLPRSAVGRLEWQIQGMTLSTCPATLIGTDAILTNAHCLVLNLPTDTGEMIDLFIEPDVYPELMEANAVLGLKLIFKPGTALDSAKVMTYEAGWTEDDNSPNGDWAVLKLEQPLGETYGFLSWRDLDFTHTETLTNISNQIALLADTDDFSTAVGPGMPTTIAQLACDALLKDRLAQDCETNSNASDGPMSATFTDIVRAIGS